MRTRAFEWVWEVAVYEKSGVYTMIIKIRLDLYCYQRIPDVKDLIPTLRQPLVVWMLTTSMMLYAYVDQDGCYWRQQFLIYNAVPWAYMSFVKNRIKVLKALNLGSKLKNNFSLKCRGFIGPLGLFFFLLKCLFSKRFQLFILIQDC